jgi:tetratricopeptide (TPR) repeat protein
MKKKTTQISKLSLPKECWAVFLSFSVGCAGAGKQASGDIYHEGSLNDLNRAPARFSMPNNEKSLSDDVKHPANVRSNADYYFTMGEAYSLEGNSRKALESYKTVLLYDPESPTVYLRLAVESLKLGMTSESINYCEAAIKIDDKRIDSHMLLAGLYSSLKAFDGAIREYEKVISLDATNSEATLYLGAVYAEKKQYRKALVYFNQLAQDEDYNSRHLAEYYQGRLYQEMKQGREAEAAYRRSLEKKPDFFDAVLALGNLYELQGKKEEEINLYMKFQKESGPNATLAEALAQNFLSKQDYERALEQLSLLEELGEDLLSVKVKIALIFVEQKKYEQAVAKLEETLAMAPESDKVRFYLAALFEELKDSEKALKYFQEIPSDSNFFSESVIHAAFLLKQQGKLSAAADVLEKGLDQKPENPQMFSLYGAIMDAKGEYEKALKRLEQGMERFPEHAQLLFYYGTLNDKIGKKELMVQTMKKVLELDPKHTQAINYLAYTYAEDSSNLSEAETLARKAHQLSPEDPFIMDTLGWVLFKQGRVKEAILWLETAHNQQPTESIIADHLGDAYIQHRLPEKAKQMYQRAMEHESDKEKQKKIEIKLTSIDSINIDPRLPASVLAPTPGAAGGN